MSKQQDQAFVPNLPQVNLLPEEILDRVGIERAIKHVILAFGLMVLALGGLWFWGQADVSKANDTLAQANAASADLTAQQDELADIGAYYEQVTANQGTIQTTMSREVLFSDLTGRLRATAPAGIAVDTVAVAADTSTATTAESGGTGLSGSCPTPDPFNKNVTVGCITVSGKADSRDQVGEYLTALEADEKFTGAFVTSTTTDNQTGAVQFTATVGLTEQVFSGRYADVAFLKGEQE